jgi:hypothetical protein
MTAELPPSDAELCELTGMTQLETKWIEVAEVEAADWDRRFRMRESIRRNRVLLRLIFVAYVTTA